MSSDVLVPQVALTDRDRSDSMAVGDDIAISVRNVGKMYYLYDRPQDRLKQAFLWGKKKLYREFWALRDVSFEVRKGETVGIVGRNGSGKSTLLQIIAGTLASTHGEVQVKGRVAALLELGSGFTPDFTGRENVYFNGSILGLSREEIDNIFDDIAAFADIGQFIDQPVKLYSSGMVVRLAFAVQAMVPKEVLVVDEALAVGDEAFQRKCMRVLEEFQDSGGSVLLVSHDTQTINRRCQDAILLFEGHMVVKDNSKAVCDIYQRMLYGSDRQRQALIEGLTRSTYSAEAAQDDPLPLEAKSVEKLIARSRPVLGEAGYDPLLQQPIETSYGNGKAEIIDAYLLDENGARVNVVICGNRYRWCYRVHFKQDARYVHFGMMLKTIDGVAVFVTSSLHEGENIPFIGRDSMVDVTFELDMNLAPATYYFNCGVSAIEVDKFVYLHRRVDVAAIRVIPRDERTADGIAFMNHQINYEIGKGNTE